MPAHLQDGVPSPQTCRKLFHTCSLHAMHLHTRPKVYHSPSLNTGMVVPTQWPKLGLLCSYSKAGVSFGWHRGHPASGHGTCPSGMPPAAHMTCVSSVSHLYHFCATGCSSESFCLPSSFHTPRHTDVAMRAECWRQRGGEDGNVRRPIRDSSARS